jgi:hypothetical protein
VPSHYEENTCQRAGPYSVPSKICPINGTRTCRTPPWHRPAKLPNAVSRMGDCADQANEVCTLPPEGQFASAYQTSDTLPYPGLAQRAYTLAAVLPKNAIVVNGNGGEVGRCVFHRVRHPQTITLSELGQCTMRCLRPSDLRRFLATLTSLCSSVREGSIDVHKPVR